MTHDTLTSDFPARPAWLAVLARATLPQLESRSPARNWHGDAARAGRWHRQRPALNAGL